MDWVDFYRVMNALLAGAALFWLSWDIKHRAKDMTRRQLYLALSLGALLFVVLEGSLEIVFIGTGIGPRIAFTTAACLWTLIGIWLGRKDDKKDARG